MGHSFGGATVLEAALQEQSIAKVVVALDPWMYPTSKEYYSSPNRSKFACLVVNSAKFHWAQNYRAIQGYLHQYPLNAAMLDLYGSGHGSLTDYPFIFNPSAGSFGYHSGLIEQVARLIHQYLLSHGTIATTSLGRVTFFKN